MRIPTLLLITDPDQPGGPVAPMLEALSAVAPGKVALQLRAKNTPDGQLLRWAKELRRASERAGALLLINGRVDIALASGADGVHLPEQGVAPNEARALLGRGALIGASRHDARGLDLAEKEGADYATLSPIGRVPGKTPPLGVDGFKTVLSDRALPVLALGGIQEPDVALLLRAGAHGIALRNTVRADRNPAEQVRRWLHLLDTVTPPRE